MTKECKKKLFDEYNRIYNPKKETCIKYHFLHNDVHINIYFDNFDEAASALTLILVYDKKYYFSSLNMNKDNLTEYLNDIDKSILGQIVHNGTLHDFYSDIEKHILNEKCIKVLYDSDIVFTNTSKYNINKEDLPFIHYIRQGKMTDISFNRLRDKCNISQDILMKIQNANKTIVRTAKIEEKCDLIVLMKKEEML